MESSPYDIGEDLWAKVNDLANDESCDWIARAEAVRLLALGERLEHGLAVRLWARVPHALRAEIADGIFTLARKAPDKVWVQAFADTLRVDPVIQVVIQRNAARSTAGPTS
jgi:hypothetical protein